MKDSNLTWEQAVQWLKSQPDKQVILQDCYYDEPALQAAQRFAKSEEWTAACRILDSYLPGKVLDLGAGNGITSYAFACLDCEVTALEPDPSNIVGIGAIHRLARESNNIINVKQGIGECLPFADDTFDVVYCRQVLHHATDLGQLLHEVARVLKPGGVLLATREHVISKEQDLDSFLNSHPLNFLYGGENAFLLNQYVELIKKSGLVIQKIYGSFDSEINYFPMKRSEYQAKIALAAQKVFGKKISEWLASQPIIQSLVGYYLSSRDQTPGRLFSFLAFKPNRTITL